MAGDWLKIEKATARKLEVIRIAGRLNIHPDHAFGLCFRFWCWCDENLKTGNAPGVSAAMLDAIFQSEGFADALVDVGWLRVRDGSLEVPNFDRHMSQSAKTRAENTVRQSVRRSRANVTNKRDTIPAELRRKVMERDFEMCRYCTWDASQVVHFGPYQMASLQIDHVIPVCDGGENTEENLVVACSVCNNFKNGRSLEACGMTLIPVAQMSQIKRDKLATREREEIEENNTLSHSRTTPIETHLSNPEFADLWDVWGRHLLETGKPLTPTTSEAQLYDLARFTIEEAMEIVRFSINRGARNLITNGDHRQEPRRSGGGNWKRKTPGLEGVI